MAASGVTIYELESNRFKTPWNGGSHPWKRGDKTENIVLGDTSYMWFANRCFLACGDLTPENYVQAAIKLNEWMRRAGGYVTSIQAQDNEMDCWPSMSVEGFISERNFVNHRGRVDKL